MLATALLLASLACCCSAVEHASETPDAGINAAEPQVAERSAAAAAAAAEAAAVQDDSVRCRLSGICEGPTTGCDGAATAGEPEDADARLACITSDAERAAAVQAAARHAWGGYRCVVWWCCILQALNYVGLSSCLWLKMSQREWCGCLAAWLMLWRQALLSAPCFVHTSA